MELYHVKLLEINLIVPKKSSECILNRFGDGLFSPKWSWSDKLSQKVERFIGAFGKMEQSEVLR